MLLQFRALIAAMDDDADLALDRLIQAAELSGDESNPFMDGGGGLDDLIRSLASTTGRVDRFVAALRQRIEKNPNEWDNHRLLAETLRQAGRFDEAVSALRQAAAIKPLERDALDLLTRWQNGRAPLDEQIEAYRQLVALSERQVKAKSPGFMRRMFGGGSDEERPIDTQPLRDRLGDLLWRRGECDQAVTVWTERMNAESPRTQLTLGRRFTEKEAYDRAAEAYGKALSLQPDNLAAHRALAELAYCGGDRAAALDHLCEVFIRGQLNAADRSSFAWDDEDDEDSYDFDGRSDAFAGSPRLWAMEFTSDPAIQKLLEDTGDPRAAERRLVLAVMTGQWDAAEREIAARKQSAPYDPMIWRLWAHLQERRFDWAEAARAWEYVRRLERTTLPQHRDQLQVVLAARRIKEAAAGVHEDPTGSGGTQPRGRTYSSYGRYGYGYGSVDDEAARLAALYVRLGEYDDAERLYLFSERGSVGDRTLTTLAGLMWRRGARDRALDLSRLAATLGTDGDGIAPYATMLASLGQADAATELLARAYVLFGSDDEEGGRYGWMWGWYRGFGDDEEDFESYQEQSIAEALYDVLRRGGATDAYLTGLQDRLLQSPDDARTAKLLMSLQIRDRRWEQAASSLTALLQRRPESAALKAELLHIHIQLEHWDDALALTRELAAGRPEIAERWRLQEAFLHLVRGDRDTALAAVRPLLDSSAVSIAGVTPRQMQTFLVAAGAHDELASYLEALSARRALDESGRALRVRTLRLLGRYDEAARAALDELWKTGGVLNAATPWLRELAGVDHAAGGSSGALLGNGAAPHDRAMITLLGEGPAAARPAFEAALRGDGDSLQARRGLILATWLAGDSSAACDANAALVEWLAPRRAAVWQPPIQRPVGDQAREFLASAQASGMDSGSALQLGMSFSTLLQQILGAGDDGDAPPPTSYERLWVAHQQLQPGLLAAAGRVDELKTLVRSQSNLAADLAAAGRSERSYYDYAYSGGYTSSYGGFGDDDDTFPSDWRRAQKQALVGALQLQPLASQLEELNGRLPPGDDDTLAAALAGLGRSDDARKWRDKSVDAWLVNLRAVDAPQLATDEDQYGWYSAGELDQDKLDALRAALLFTEVDDCVCRDSDATNETALDKDETKIDGVADELWELALLHPEAEAKLLELEKQVGPGWESSRTVQQLLSYWKARKRPQEAIALLEDVLPFNELLTSERLSDYLGACFAAKDYPRIERVLESARQRSRALTNAADLVQVVLWRLGGRTSEADALEDTLLRTCREGPPGVLHPEPVLTEARHEARGFSAYGRNDPYFTGGYGNDDGEDVPLAGQTDVSAPALAEALGIRLEDPSHDEDLTLAQIEGLYARHKLYADAARMVEMQLQQSPPAAVRARADLLMRKAEHLHRANDGGAARDALAQSVALWTQEMNRASSDPGPPRRLASILGHRELGDAAGALEALREAKRRDPGVDLSGADEAELLFRLDRFEDAWSLYRLALRRGVLGGMDDPDTLLKAGLAACRADAREAGLPLLRMGLWLAPDHELAALARSHIDG